MTVTDSAYLIAKNLVNVEGWLGLSEANELYASVEMVRAWCTAPYVVEIGSWKGKSTISLALALAGTDGKVVAIDPHDTTVVDHVDEYGAVKTFDEFIANVTRAGVADRVIPIRKMSTDAAPEALVRPIDVLFVDGSHRYEDVIRDLDLYLPGLAERAVLALNDPSREGVYRALCERVLSRQDLFNARLVENTLFLDRQAGRKQTIDDRWRRVRMHILLRVRYEYVRRGIRLPSSLRSLVGVFVFRIAGFKQKKSSLQHTLAD